MNDISFPGCLPGKSAISQGFFKKKPFSRFFSKSAISRIISRIREIPSPSDGPSSTIATAGSMGTSPTGRMPLAGTATASTDDRPQRATDNVP